MKSIGTFFYRLLFDREDSLDTLQLMFLIIVIMTLAVVWKLTGTTSETATVKVESLVTLRWLVGLLVITAVPKWMIPSMVSVMSRGALPSFPATSTSSDAESDTPITPEQEADIPDEHTS